MQELTERLSFPPPIRGEEDRGSHNFCRATSITRSRAKQGEILRQLHCLVRCACLSYTDLECGDRACWILSPWSDDTPLTAITKLLVVGNPRKQVNNCRGLLTAVRYVPFKFGAVPLFCGLGTYHWPYYFFLCPWPPQCPTRGHYTPVHLEVIHCHNCLLKVPRYSSVKSL